MLLVRTNFGGLATLPLCLKLSHHSSEILMQSIASPFQTQIQKFHDISTESSSQHKTILWYNNKNT